MLLTVLRGDAWMNRDENMLWDRKRRNERVYRQVRPLWYPKVNVLTSG